MGAAGVVRAARGSRVTRAQAAIVRFVLICAAWAVGQTLAWGVAAGPIGVIMPAALAIGVLVVTEGLGRPRPSGGSAKYWRGQRVDDRADKGRDRWN
jgi:hypothetical protein